MDPISEAAEDIRSMRVRGAALIGKHAAKALGRFADQWDGSPAALDQAAQALVAARPTAVSLPNAVRFVVRRGKEGGTPDALRKAADEFVRRAQAALGDIGRHGAPLIEDGMTLLTICNSQGALAPMFEAARQGRRFRVVALETRPWRQGLLTVAQLHKEGVDAALAVDSAMWTLLEEADLVLTGADSIARNGDVINKVGTGGLAVLARERGVPLHCCAESFKLDASAATGKDVVIEERETTEVVQPGEIPDGVRIRNPVFDVTPNACVTSYVTEAGVLSRDALVKAARETWGV
ncbi:MAG TPA: S-methyl-5-thioribose-1-phosphate isomerase [Candidatus Thermoplasmatota archaeon]|nr:S-methyl-5-thioribose-1-phosphate isomerase [Candidatus Thermoplasmatota archaeon]